jgi:hypothetical protein
MRGDRELDMQPVPIVSRADVERVVRRDFDEQLHARVSAILDRSREGGWPMGDDRVHLAALNLAAGNVEELSHLLNGSDYRDLLAAAEYPLYMRTPAISSLPTAERQRIIDQDWAQYQEWLQRR